MFPAFYLALSVYFICVVNGQKTTPYTSKLVQLTSIAQQQGLMTPGDILFPNDYGVNEMAWLTVTEYGLMGGRKSLQGDGVK